MKRILQVIFKPFLTWLANRFDSKPDRKKVMASLSKLLRSMNQKPGKRGLVLEMDLTKNKFIIFSDQHKGNKDQSDDFKNNEPSYLAALTEYHKQGFHFINLGDSEELWKYHTSQVMPNNLASFKLESLFHDENKYYKAFGNHDLNWKNKIDVESCFKSTFKLPLPVYEGFLLKAHVGDKPLSIYLTHGHQGDLMSDNNALSTWLVAHIWRPIQRYLEINVNTPAKDYHLRGKHNIMMYEWSSKKKNLLLITGHTHVPVFASGRYSDHPANKLDPTQDVTQKELKPSYFNTGCCCFNDGNITGIEIADGSIRLIKWFTENNVSQRIVLEEILLSELIGELG